MATDSGTQSKTTAAFGKQDFGMEDQCKLQQVLAKKLGPSLISQRPSSTEGQRVAFVETWKLVSLANELFGFNGWSNSITSQTIDYVDEVDGRYHVGVSACVRVTLKDGAYHEELGYGVSEGLVSKGFSIERARKEAVSDGLKRSLRHFGNALGNCLGDKLYLQWVVNASDASPANCSKPSDSLLSELVTSAQMTAPPAAAPAPASSAPSQASEAKQPTQPQPQQVLQVQLPHQAPALQTQRLPGPFQQQLPILQPITLATASGGLNTSSAQQLFLVRPMSQAGLSPGVATLTAIPSSGLQTLTALPSSSLHTLTQLSQHPHLSQPTQLAQSTQLQQPILSQSSNLASALQQSAVHCSQQQAQHFAPLQGVQSVLAHNQPKTSITQAVNQIKSLFNKNKQPVFSTCPPQLSSNSVASSLQCMLASSCTTTASIYSNLQNMQSHGQVRAASTLNTSVVTAAPSSGTVQNGVTTTKAPNMVNNTSQSAAQGLPSNSFQCLKSNVKIIQNRYQGNTRPNLHPATSGPVRDIQPRASVQAAPQREKGNSNSSDSSDQSRPRLRVVCPPLEAESQPQGEDQNLPVSKKKRARSRSSQRAGSDPSENTSSTLRDSPRTVKKACLPLVTIHSPFENSDTIEIKQERMDYDDTMPTLVYPELMNKCEVVIESAYSLSSKDDETSFASEKANDGDDEDEDDESVTVAKAMNTLFREGVRGQDSDFDQFSDHLLRDAVNACSPLKFSSDPTNASSVDSDRNVAEVLGSSEQQDTNEFPPPAADQRRDSSTDCPSSNNSTQSVAITDSLLDNEDAEIKDKLINKTVPEGSPRKAALEAGTKMILGKNKTSPILNSKPDISTRIDSELTSQNKLNFSVFNCSDDSNGVEFGKEETKSVLLDPMENDKMKKDTKSTEQKNNQGDKTRRKSVVYTPCEIKSKSKGKNPSNTPSRKCVINNICSKNGSNNPGTSVKRKEDQLAKGPTAKRSGSAKAARACATEDTAGASQVKSKMEFKDADKEPSNSKADTVPQLTLDVFFGAEARESCQENPDAKTTRKVVAESDILLSKKTISPHNPQDASTPAKTDASSSAKTDVLFTAKTDALPPAKTDVSSQAKTDASSLVKTDAPAGTNGSVLPAPKSDLQTTEINFAFKSTTDSISSSTVDSTLTSVVIQVPKLDTDTTVEVKSNSTNVSVVAADSIETESANSVITADPGNLKADVNAVQRTKYETSSCLSQDGEKAVSKDVAASTENIVTAAADSKNEVADDKLLDSCDASRVEKEHASLVPPAEHASEDRTFEELFEGINSPLSDTENSFTGFTEAMQLSVPVTEGATATSSKESRVKDKSPKQNWKFKFKARGGSATNACPKKYGRISSASAATKSSSSSSTKISSRNSSCAKKIDSDADLGSLRSPRHAPEMSPLSLSSSINESFEGPDAGPLSTEKSCPLTPAAEENNLASPQNPQVTPDKSKEKLLSPTAAAKQQLVSMEDGNTHPVSNNSSCIQDPIRGSVTAIITEDAAVTSLATLVTNGSLLPSPEASPRPEKAPSPTLGKDCSKNKSPGAPQAPQILQTDKLNSTELVPTKEVFTASEDLDLNHTRKFDPALNGDVR